MNKEVAKKWAEALRSSEYKQGTSALLMDNKHCCLGVLCEVYKKETGDGQWKEADGNEMCGFHITAALMFTTINGGDTQLPPNAVYNWAGMNDSNPVVRYEGLLTHFSELNDKNRLSFDEIAEIIEDQCECL
jgi:hypothetical protein